MFRLAFSRRAVHHPEDSKFKLAEGWITLANPPHVRTLPDVRCSITYFTVAGSTRHSFTGTHRAGENPKHNFSPVGHDGGGSEGAAGHAGKLIGGVTVTQVLPAEFDVHTVAVS